ncbi:MAG: hypothetical protein QW567_02650 [Candidatus Hadarchaeales archaeon]
MGKGGPGSASVTAGALIAALSIVALMLTAMNLIPNQTWGITQITNYVLCCFGLAIGLIMMGYGAYIWVLSGRYVERIEALEREKASQEGKMRQMELEVAMLQGRLRSAHRKLKRKTKLVRKLSGSLGDRTRRLKEIARLAKIVRKRR